ncbi:MAG: DUF4279 domain-containing protein [Propionibacteriaceae bacterium]|nr:DUF4279 domain-containing protein [Propionibacteriaceae bacterium]
MSTPDKYVSGGVKFFAETAFDFDEFTAVVGVKPTGIRPSNDTSNSKWARWDYELESKGEPSVDALLSQLERAVGSRAGAIGEYCASHGIHAWVWSYVEAPMSDVPKLRLSNRVLELCGAVGAGVDIDLLVDDGEEPEPLEEWLASPPAEDETVYRIRVRARIRFSSVVDMDALAAATGLALSTDAPKEASWCGEWAWETGTYTVLERALAVFVGRAAEVGKYCAERGISVSVAVDAKSGDDKSPALDVYRPEARMVAELGADLLFNVSWCDAETEALYQEAKAVGAVNWNAGPGVPEARRTPDGSRQATSI